MGKVIAITNQKGGVGKTTTSVNLAASLVYHGKRVLLIDMDPQGNATMGSGINKQSLELTINDVLLGEATAMAIVRTTDAGFDVLPSNSELTIAEVTLLSMVSRELRLKRALTDLMTTYDYILIDCPPALNALTLNALVASDSVLIPMQCEYFALEGLTALLGTVEQINQTIHPSLHLEGILRTMFDARNKLTQEVSEQLTRHFPGQVYHTVIPRNVRLAEAPSHGKAALQYDANSQGAVAYVMLAAELIKRQEKRTSQEHQHDAKNSHEQDVVLETVRTSDEAVA